MSCFDETFIQAQIDYFQTLITEIQTATTQLTIGKIQSYTLNTGQTVQTVTKKNMKAMTEALNWAYDMLQYWCSLLHGGATIIARPL